MSNDTKFWVTRVALYAAIGIDLWFMKKMTGEAFNAGTHTAMWAWLFFVAVMLTLPIGFVAYKAKRARWEPAKPMDRVEVETLADYSKRERIAKEQEKLKK